MKSVLVTGSEGQLGKCLQKIANNYDSLNFKFMDSKDLDITNAKSLNSAFDSEHYDYCINCAAYTNVEQAEKTPNTAFQVNAYGVKQLAIQCNKHDVILIHISTDYVFDGNKKGGYLPSDRPNPINQYGKSKLQGEHYIQEILEEYAIIRSSWLYSEYGHNFYKTILDKAKKKETLCVTDSQVGCPTNANHLAVFIMDIVLTQHFKTGIYHFTDGEAMSWYEFAKRIVKEHHLDSHVKVVKDKNYRTFARRPGNSILIDAKNSLS